MTSYFAAIQNWFSSGFYGRHLGLILQELGKWQPEALTSFASYNLQIPKLDLRHARFEAEVAFEGRTSWRRADLGVYLEDDDDPIVLIEIKYFDKPIPETGTKPAQLDDYLFWKNAKKGRHVMVLSREMFNAQGLKLVRWDEFARHLRPYGQKSDLVRMMVEYLEEEGIVMQKVNGYALMRYFKRLVCHRWKSGVLANNIEGPAEFTRLLKNLRLISGKYDLEFKQAWRAAGLAVAGKEAAAKVASIDFEVRTNLKPLKGKKSYVNLNGELNSEMKDGGVIDVKATHSLGSGSGRYMRISYGFLFDVDPEDNKNEPPAVRLYAQACGHEIANAKLNVLYMRTGQYSWVTDSADASVTRIERIVSELLQKAINKVVDARLPLHQDQKKALRLLSKSLEKDERPKLEIV